MSKAELRAQQIFNSFNLREEDEEVRRNLMILLLTETSANRRPRSYVEAIRTLEGAWENDGLVVEEEIDAIYQARHNGETRKIIEL